MSEIIEMQKGKKAIEFEPIPVPEDFDLDQLHRALDGAEAALHKYKRILEHAKKMDEVTDDLAITSWEYDWLTEYDMLHIYGHCSIDIITHLYEHLKKQVARFTQFCEDLEAEIEDWKEQEANDAEYGTYDEQVRSYFYSTR